jgi:hypothetical protein
MTFDVTDREGIGIDSNGVRLRYFFILLAVLDRVPEIQTFHAFYWKQSLTIRRFGGVGMIRSATIGRKDGGLPMGGGRSWHGKQAKISHASCQDSNLRRSRYCEPLRP